ncbi:16S rRNA (cytidine(1402)-2'-O)-methyltransferase [Oceanobacillus piezotolerans]|uniref:Ribosomal RNA small subunit methyltransferase I n=1 Tax=Oceanobacillus piezotolerans TaxID=2448030 RepID=A0A498D7C4_9BACI|nr:16S rRNA (cytidine(1402)-2'-O)-methyltransferase [Oceanobacillus piezotolerans]RLL41697.1 16S rRNA (cytidine(1402)-2'-O)-methyltransferase [Oceanobacillus piezotolerans]
MNNQKSFEDESSGLLYVVPTPIGNLEDITFRALQVLKDAAIVAAEDTRNTRKLFNHFDIDTPLISYHEYSNKEREEQLLERVAKGESIAIVSDAGMPAISDPGYEIVRAATERDLKVVVLPGANAALCALVGSGLPTNEFYFYGFLPRKKKEKADALTQLKFLKATILFYESPYRVKDTLSSMKDVLGNRKVAVARELTKRFEEYTRGTLEEIVDFLNQHEPKGEFCIVVEGNTSNEEPNHSIWWNDLNVIEHIEHYMEEEQLSSKDAIKKVATDRNLPKREVYQAYHIK